MIFSLLPVMSLQPATETQTEHALDVIASFFDQSF